jgi:hypothetical protein
MVILDEENYVEAYGMMNTGKKCVLFYFPIESLMQKIEKLIGKSI